MGVREDTAGNLNDVSSAHSGALDSASSNLGATGNDASGASGCSDDAGLRRPGAGTNSGGQRFRNEDAGNACSTDGPVGRSKRRRAVKRALKSGNLHVESVNSTGWNALKERLRVSKAAIICAQEHHTLVEDVDER